LAAIQELPKMKKFKDKYLTFKFLAKAIFVFLLVASVIELVSNSYQLLFKTYRVNDSEIYIVDTFKLQTKAYYNVGGKYHSPTYDFKSTNGYSFFVDEKVFQGISDKKAFYDTFLYHGLKFIAYSDKETAKKYSESVNPIFIKIFQIQVGEKKFIKTEQFNNAYRNKLLRKILIATFIFIILYFTYRKTGEVFD
jgi:hypothetical protein